MNNFDYLFEEYFKSNYLLERINEALDNTKKLRLNEWLTLGALQVSDAVSPFTRSKRQIRLQYYKPENITAKLIQCEYDSAKDTMTFFWLTDATMKAHEPEYQCQETDPLNGFKLKLNPSNTYTMMIRIIDFCKWLKDTRPDNMNGKPITQKEIKDVLDVAYVQVFCNDPSFQYQVANYCCSQVDASIYPTTIAPKQWNKIHGTDSFLCKHLMGLLKSISFWLNPMASMASKKLQELKLI